MPTPDVSRKPRLSVAILARDAADKLAATIDSVRSLADEIVVADTGSADATVRTARQCGASVVQLPWVDDFSQSRNDARTYLTGDWVLWLDAGETLAPDSAAELRAFLDEQAINTRAYMFMVVVPPATANIDGEQVGRIRLLPNRADLRFEGRVRERVRPAVSAAGMSIEGLPWRILRSTSEHDEQVKLGKARRNLRLADLEIKENGSSAHSLVTLGESLARLGEHIRAAACFRQAQQTAEPASTTLREAYYGLLEACDAEASLRTGRLAICVEALTAFPIDTQLLCAMGGYLQSDGRLDLAARSYETAVEFGQVDPETWHLPDIDGIAAVCLSVTHQLRGNDEQAVRVLQQSLEQVTDSERVRRQLIDLHIKHDRRQDALAEADRLASDSSQREALRTAVRGACLAAKQNWGSALAYLQTAYEAGCRDPLCLRWLSVTLVSAGDTTAAAPVIDEWLRVEPRSIEAQKYREAVHGGERHMRVDDAEPAGAGHTMPAPVWERTT